MKFKVGFRKSVAENAGIYYEKSKKSKRKVEGARFALKDTLAKLEKQEELDEQAATEQPVVKKKPTLKWFEKFRWFNSSDGFLVVGGKDATSNEVLIKKHTEKKDLVFHANVQGAPFFVIKNPEGIDVTEDTMLETARAAASYSSAWKHGVGSCDVYAIAPDQVSKTAPSGEYVPKGGFIISGTKNWFRNTPLGVAVGITGEGQVIGGPATAVEKHANVVVKIGVGDSKQGELAKKIKKVLGKDADLDEIQGFIPAGKGQIVKR